MLFIEMEVKIFNSNGLCIYILCFPKITSQCIYIIEEVDGDGGIIKLQRQ